MSESMNHLLRGHAPIAASGWSEIDDEARQRLTCRLGARAVVDWNGPGGWEQSAVNLGRTTKLDGAPPGCGGDSVRASLRRVQPLAEVRVPFTVDRGELDNAARGAQDVDFDDLARAARLAAEIENRAVFHGWPDAGIEGIFRSVTTVPRLGEDVQSYPDAVADAVAKLRADGIDGPYALAIEPAGFTRIAQTTERGGYLLMDHLQRLLLGGKVVWTPGISGAAIVSQRGGDFVLDVGQDLAVGYSHHDADTVTLYFEESFTFRVNSPDAAIALVD